MRLIRVGLLIFLLQLLLYEAEAKEEKIKVKFVKPIAVGIAKADSG